MKKLQLFVLIAFFAGPGFAQSPAAFHYQAVLHSEDGNPILNTDITLKISILSDTVLNTILYAELQNVSTDAFGRISVQVGRGDIISGDFPSIGWENGNVFIRVEYDFTGTGTFTMAGQTQLLSVPYALFAEKSGETYTAGNGISIFQQTISNTGDLSNTNEIQTLVKLGNTIILNPGGSSVTDADQQTLTVNSSGNNRQLEISSGNTINFDVSDSDNDPVNELQVVSISRDTIFLSNGGFVKLPQATNAIIPAGGCIHSTNPIPPQGYTYSGTGFSAGDQWNTLPSMNFARFGASVAAVGSKIYVIGGWDGITEVSNIVEAYDINSQTWERKANLLTAVVYSACAVVGNSIHVFGGYNGNSITNKHQVYNTVTNNWSYSANLPQARSGCGAAAVSGKIYLIGGFYNNTPVDLNQMYDPSTNTWSTKTPMLTARTDFATVATPQGIYIIGGWNQDVLNVNEFYSTANDTWTTYYSSPIYRAGCSGTYFNDKIYITGGGDAYSYIGTTEEYDPMANQWKIKSSMPVSTSYFGMVTLNEKIYTVGGNYGIAQRSLNEYNPVIIQYYIHCSE